MNQSGYLNRGLHNIYWEEHGNPNGKPVIIIHGGPGGQINHRWGSFFNQEEWRIIFFDQRGCGKSTPFGETEENTLDNIVQDMEEIRQMLNIDKWTLFGGSWGTTVAIAYGLAHPNRCQSFLLRGIWLARPEDIDWYMWGAKQVYPEMHEKLVNEVKEATAYTAHNAQQLINIVYKAFKNNIETSRAMKLAKAWFAYEMHLSALDPIEFNEDEDMNVALTIAKLEAYYLATQLPLKNDLLSQVRNSPVKDIHCEIVHGRYDMVCPVDEAYELHKVWKNSNINIAPRSGHYTFEPELEKRLHLAVEKL